MTISQTQMRPYLLELAEMLAEVLKEQLRPDIADIIDIVYTELLWFEKHMHRRKGIRPRAPNKSPPMTLELRWRLRRDALAHPELTQQEIANRNGVNTGGRVNEALNGKLPQNKIIRPGSRRLKRRPDDRPEAPH